MMIFIKFLLIAVLIQSTVNESSRCRNCEVLSVEQLRQLRYEYLKNQILKKLHLSEPPKTNLPKPPLKSLLAIANMAENETPLEIADQAKIESVVMYPKNDSLNCSESESHDCCRFEFVLPESLPLENILSAEVWYYKNAARNVRVYQIIPDNLQNLTRSLELDNIVTQRNIRSWVKCNIPRENIRWNLTTENSLVLEISGCISARNSITSSTGEEKPFLVIRSEEFDESSRQRRSTTCGEASSACCKENFFLNFSEIGWDNWILHPDGYQANFCRGRCLNELSSTRFYHSTVLLSYIKDNKDIAEEMGLSMCCTPSVMAPVAIIYRNEDGLIYHKSIDNMKVESCDCA